MRYQQDAVYDDYWINANLACQAKTIVRVKWVMFEQVLAPLPRKE